MPNGCLCRRSNFEHLGISVHSIDLVFADRCRLEFLGKTGRWRCILLKDFLPPFLLRKSGVVENSLHTQKNNFPTNSSRMISIYLKKHPDVDWAYFNYCSHGVFTSERTVTLWQAYCWYTTFRNRQFREFWTHPMTYRIFNVSQNMGLIKKPMGPKFHTQKRLTFRNLKRIVWFRWVFFLQMGVFSGSMLINLGCSHPKLTQVFCPACDTIQIALDQLGWWLLHWFHVDSLNYWLLFQTAHQKKQGKFPRGWMFFVCFAEKTLYLDTKWQGNDSRTL